MWESGCLIVDDIGLRAYQHLLGSVTDSWADISKSKYTCGQQGAAELSSSGAGRRRQESTPFKSETGGPDFSVMNKAK